MCSLAGGGWSGRMMGCIIQLLTWLVQLMPLLFHKPFTPYCERVCECEALFFFFTSFILYVYVGRL